MYLKVIGLDDFLINSNHNLILDVVAVVVH